MLVPFYDSGGITLYCGDCREIVPTLGQFDLVLVDPPYGDTSLKWDVRDGSWLDLVKPHLVESGSMWCFGSLRMFLALSRSGDLDGWKQAQDVVWEKNNGSTFHADRFRRVHEQIVQFYPDSVPWEKIYKSPVAGEGETPTTKRHKKRPPHAGHEDRPAFLSDDGGPRLARSVMKVPSCHGYADHPTQKPVALLRPLIEYSCAPGKILLDPFCGAGSALVAAKEMGRRAVGIEIDPKYAAAAARRLGQEVMTFCL